MESQYPILKTLTRRQLEMLYLKNISVPSDAFQVIDLTQNLGFANVTTEKFPTITPCGEKFLTKQVRFVTPAECMRLQGNWLNDAVLQKFPGPLIQDLAGNAYEMTCCGASLLCIFTFLAMNHRCKLLQTLPPTPARATPAQVEGDQQKKTPFLCRAASDFLDPESDLFQC